MRINNIVVQTSNKANLATSYLQEEVQKGLLAGGIHCPTTTTTTKWTEG
jgi:hypothetical protein